MNAAEMQYAIDRKGYLYVPAGDHTIETPIILGRSSREVVIECHPNGRVVSSGLSSQGVFEYDHPGTYDSPVIKFYGVRIDANGTRVPCFNVKNSGTSPRRLEFEKCEFWGGGSYIINGRSVGQSEGIVIKDCKSAQQVGLRWKTSTPGQYVTDFVNVENWRQITGSRAGPAIDLDSCLGVRLVQVIDDGSPNLTAGLIGVYAGPIGMRINNPGPHCLIDDYWLEPWGDWATLAPNCFAGEFRCDDTTGIRRHQVTCRNFSCLANGITEAKFRIVGGHDSASASSIRVDFEDMAAMKKEEILLAGKSWTTNTRGWYTNGGTTYPQLKNKLDTLVSNSFRDWIIEAGKNRAPSPIENTYTSYPGTNLDNNFFTTMPDYESLI